MIRKKILLIIVLIISCFFPINEGITGEQDEKNVLLINSYHKGYKWTDDITEAVESVFIEDSLKINLMVDNMDTQRVENEDYFIKLYDVYKYKYGNSDSDIDLIICSDDNAFNFVLKFQKEVLPDIPVVFCGVNYFEESMLQGHKKITGVVEVYDLQETINIALQQNPGTENIYIIHDNTNTGKAIKKYFTSISSQLEKSLNIKFLQEYNLDQIVANVKSLPENSIVLFLIYFQDENGKYYSYDESIKIISDSSSVPVYGVWDFCLGNGIVGGMLTSGFNQGEMAAKIALRILKGEDPDEIAVIKKNTNSYKFDYEQIKRFNLNLDMLPVDSIIINKNYNNKKQVLVLNSYHFGMSWTEKVLSGIESVLNDNNVILYYEFMDFKKNNTPEYNRGIYNLLINKYKNKKFDAVITVDDNAFNFTKKYYKLVFPDTPVVFCGVNYYIEDGLNSNFTGVVETIDVEKTLNMALKLNPNTKKIVVVNDTTITGKANKKLLQEKMSKYKDEIEFIFFENMNMSEIQSEISILSNDTIIFLLTFSIDRSKNTFSYEESAELISRYAKVPIYGVWDMYLDHGIVGGMLTNGFNQGQKAAQIVNKILNGEKPSNIPVINEKMNNWYFDYKKLKAFNIKEENLPQGTIVINKPLPFYTKYKYYISLIIFLLLLIIVIINVEKRKAAERKLRLIATIDSLTGVNNRRTGLKLLEEKIAECVKKNRKLVVCFIDIDNLKMVNDKYGHSEGDILIKKAIKIIQKNLKEKDIICRLGGDEFLIIYSEVDLYEANKSCENMKKNFIEENKYSNKYTIMISSGLAEYDPQQPLDYNELIRIADKKMYEEKTKKKKGRK